MTQEKNLEQMLREDGLCAVSIGGTSMQPMLHAGDCVLLAAPQLPPEKGTVALYRKGEHYVLHRIVGKKNDAYIFCGDNCVEREAVAERDILGVLEGFWREGSFYDCTGAYSEAFARRARRTRALRAVWRRVKARLVRREKTMG